MSFGFGGEQESQLEDERGKNEQLKEEADLLRRKAQLLDQVGVELLIFLRHVQLNSSPLSPFLLLWFRQTLAENEELREDLSEVTAQHNSVLEENQRLRAKLENLEQVLKVAPAQDLCPPLVGGVAS